MAIKIDSNMSAVAYHIVDGPQDFPYAVDAQSAVGRHPLEWSMQPWTAEASDAARKQLADRYERDAAIAKSRGLPPPVAPAWLDAEPVQPTPEEQAAIDEHAKAVAEAAERLNKRRAELAKQKEIDDQVAADEALVASPPPRPDPTAPRPLSKKEKRAEFLKLTPEEQAEADRNIGIAPANTQPADTQPVAPQPVAPSPITPVPTPISVGAPIAPPIPPAA
jgi:hypothetical protein